jgi:thiosulfate dehydrogenase
MSARRARGLLPAAAWLALSTAACGDGDRVEHVPAAARGEALFRRGLTDNELTCATCHRARHEPRDERVLPGADLAGVTERPSYWGGAESDLLRAVGYCQTRFMGVERPLATTDPEASELYAFLESLQGASDAVPFTVVRTVSDLPPGDATRGLSLYERTCAGCHGAPDTGDGALAPRIPTLPEDVLRQHSEYDAREQRLVFVEKVRHGAFLGYDGEMPPFSLEALADAELADVLSALGLDVDEEEP